MKKTRKNRKKHTDHKGIKKNLFLFADHIIVCVENYKKFYQNNPRTNKYV